MSTALMIILYTPLILIALLHVNMYMMRRKGETLDQQIKRLEAQVEALNDYKNNRIK